MDGLVWNGPRGLLRAATEIRSAPSIIALDYQFAILTLIELDFNLYTEF